MSSITGLPQHDYSGVAEALRALEAHTVVLTTPDAQGRLVGKRLPAQRFASQPRVDVCSAILAWDAAQEPGVPVTVTGPHTGWNDWRLVADPSTLRRLAWLDGVALCMADVVEPGTLTNVSVAPREVLRRQCEALAQRGYQASVATELEFYLYETSFREARASGYRDLEATTPIRSDFTIQAGNEHAPYFDELTAALVASGIEVEAVLPEWGRGQWEVNVRHDDPLTTADHHALLRLALRDLASRHGKSVTFMPLPHAEDVGSSCHLHLSLRDVRGEAVFHDADHARGMSAALGHAVAGALEHLADVLPLYAPTVNAYRRIGGDGFAGRGGTWGYDNRTVTARVVGDGPDTMRLEFRLAGADANPYLALAALIASVVDGLDRKLDPGSPVEGNAYAQEVAPVPRTLAEAATRMQASDWARAALSSDVVDHYATLALHEEAEFAKTVTEWERTRYFELM